LVLITSLDSWYPLDLSTAGFKLISTDNAVTLILLIETKYSQNVLGEEINMEPITQRL